MNTFRKLMLSTLFLAFLSNSLHAQTSPNENDQYSSAYMQSSQTAHWSAYIPITVLVAAAVVFGVADRDGKGHHDRGQSLGTRSSKSGRYGHNGYSH